MIIEATDEEIYKLNNISLCSFNKYNNNLCINCLKRYTNIENIESQNSIQENSKNMKIVNSNKLTKREKEILNLMGMNLTNQQISDRLYISTSTVKSHVSSVLSKLGQSNRSQAIIYSLKNGLIRL